MADPVIVTFVVLICILLSHRPLMRIISQRRAAALKEKSIPLQQTPPSTPAPEKRTMSFYEEGEIPVPDPLYITPEQVKTYDDRPWRPFRWPYHQTMSIFKLDINHWLDMDKYYWHYIQEKERIYHEYGDDNLAWLPEGYEGSFELMEIVTQHMLKRYPLLFTSPDGGFHVKNELTGELLDMSLPLKEHPLIYVSKMAKEDFYIVKKGEDGQHRLVAAAVPFPGGSFGISHKIGRTLDVIHTDVPYYKEKLKKSMERWFSKMTASDPVERASWYCTWDKDLLVSNVYNLKENEKLESGVADHEFMVRVERQTLRRLPKSQVIIFTNHPVYYSIEEMKDEPLVPTLLRKIINEAPEGISKYKNFTAFKDYITPYLDRLVKRQEDLGIIEKDQAPKTLPSYPFAHFVTQRDEIQGWNMAMMKKQDDARAQKEKEEEEQKEKRSDIVPEAKAQTV